MSSSDMKHFIIKHQMEIPDTNIVVWSARWNYQWRKMKALPLEFLVIIFLAEGDSKWI